MARAMQRRSRHAPVALLAMLCAAGTAAAAGCRIERYPAIPVTMKDMQALIRVRINGKPAILAVDSGAFFSMLSPQGARRLKLTDLYAPPGLFLAGVGGETLADLVSAHTFSFDHQRLHNVQFLVAGTTTFRTRSACSATTCYGWRTSSSISPRASCASSSPCTAAICRSPTGPAISRSACSICTTRPVVRRSSSAQPGSTDIASR